MAVAAASVTLPILSTPSLSCSARSRSFGSTQQFGFHTFHATVFKLSPKTFWRKGIGVSFQCSAGSYRTIWYNKTSIAINKEKPTYSIDSCLSVRNNVVGVDGGVRGRLACLCRKCRGVEHRRRTAALTPELKSTLDKVVSSHKVVLFMKGTKEFPQCGFSNTVVQILKSLNMPFETLNILENENLRQGLKEYSNWPTFPQLYIDGVFFGGCDITVEAYKTGELQELLEKAMCS